MVSEQEFLKLKQELKALKKAFIHFLQWTRGDLLKNEEADALIKEAEGER